MLHHYQHFTQQAPAVQRTSLHAQRTAGIRTGKADLRRSSRTRATAPPGEIETVTLSDGRTSSSARLVGFENGTYTVEGSIRTDASVEEVWNVLTDYEALADIFCNIKSSRVISRQPGIVLHQDCTWEFLIFSGKFGAQLSVHEDRWQRSLDFRLLQSSFMRSFVGQWRVTAGPGGRGSAVDHRLSVAPSLSPPAPLRGYTQKIFVRQVAMILQDLDKELQRRSSGDS